jgi:hypothetical protein
MKRTLVVLAVLIAALAVAPSAQAHPDYRPWKQAMFGWLDNYEATIWAANLHAAVANGTFSEKLVVMESPPVGQNQNSGRNVWDWQTRDFAMFITATSPPYVCDEEFTLELRAILRPYLPVEGTPIHASHLRRLLEVHDRRTR